MDHERHILRIPLGDCPREEVALRLKKHAGVDLDAVQEKYGSSVRDAQELLCRSLEIAVVYQCFTVDSVGENEVLLAGGQRFTGSMPPRILEKAEQVVCFVATLPGFQSLRDSTGDVMVDYFLDTWGTVYAECGQRWLETLLADQLAAEGQRPAYAWNPGQSQFELRNQKTLFSLLQPEDIGCTLDKHMRMIPFKSTSGIIPVLAKDVPAEEDLIPCEFCSLGKTCPASKARVK